MQGNEVIGYADPAANNNLGDQLLWAGSNKLFMRFGKHPVLHCGGSQTKGIILPCVSMGDDFKSKLGNGKGILWYNPGGNWGNLYRHVQDGRLDVWKLAKSFNIPFISGPQSIFYQGSMEKATLADDEFIAKYGTKRDLLTFRQHNSYLFALEHYNSTTVRESPDMAFMLGPQIPNKMPKFDVFLMVRSDSESTLGAWDKGWDNHDKICRGIILEGYTCGIGDWGVGNHVVRQRPNLKDYEAPHGTYADIGLQIALSTVSHGEVIISDRLHGVLLSFLAGKTVIYVDNAYKKLSHVFYTAFRNKNECANTDDLGVYDAEANTVEDIIKTAIAVLKKKGTKVDKLEKEAKRAALLARNKKDIDEELLHSKQNQVNHAGMPDSSGPLADPFHKLGQQTTTPPTLPPVSEVAQPVLQPADNSVDLPIRNSNEQQHLYHHHLYHHHLDGC